MDISKLVEEFEATVRADEFKGGGDPADVSQIEADYVAAKRALLSAFSQGYNEGLAWAMSRRLSRRALPFFGDAP